MHSTKNAITLLRVRFSGLSFMQSQGYYDHWSRLHEKYFGPPFANKYVFNVRDTRRFSVISYLFSISLHLIRNNYHTKYTWN
jgi:hypothetical protein